MISVQCVGNNVQGKDYSLTWDTVPEFPWRDQGEVRKPSVSISGLQVKIWAQDLPNKKHTTVTFGTDSFTLTAHLTCWVPSSFLLSAVLPPSWFVRIYENFYHDSASEVNVYWHSMHIPNCCTLNCPTLCLLLSSIVSLFSLHKRHWCTLSY